jgi:hypothetical protein
VFERSADAVPYARVGSRPANGRRGSKGSLSRTNSYPKKKDRAPLVETPASERLIAAKDSGSGVPTAPAGDCLRLLPSGPDLVHKPTPRGTRPIDTPSGGATGAKPLEGEFSPARADCGFRAPLHPRLARSVADRSANGRTRERERRPDEAIDNALRCESTWPCDANRHGPATRSTRPRDAIDTAPRRDRHGPVTRFDTDPPGDRRGPLQGQACFDAAQTTPMR